MRFLIADDVYYARKAVEKMVLAWDSASEIVELCDNGARVIALLAAKSVDVLILDIRMPGVDGLQLAELARTDYPDVRIILVSGYAEFEYAQKAVRSGVFRYLLKPLKREELFAALDELKQLCADTRGQDAPTDVRHVAASYRMIRYLSGVEGAQPEGLPLTEELLRRGYRLAYLRSQGMATLRLMTLVQQAFGDGAFLYDDLLHAHSHVLLLCNYAGVSESSFAKTSLPERLVELAAESEGEALFIGLSPVEHASALMPERFQQAQRALALRLLSPRERVFVFDDSQGKRLLSRDDLRLIKSKLQAHRGDEVERLVTDRVRQSPLCNLARLEQVYADLLAVCMTILMEQGASGEQNAVPRKLWEFDDVRQTRDYLLGLVGEPKAGAPTEGSVVKDICAFLEENYYCDISLNELAATKYYLNPNYLSRLFKAEAGVGFSKYLLRVRMEKARELLRSTSLSVGEVASMVGYTSTSYFIANFKKAFGETPGSIDDHPDK